MLWTKDDAQHHVALIKRKRYYIMKQTDLKHFMNTSKSIQKLVGFLGVWTLLLSAISSSTTVASSLNPLAEDGGAIPPDSPAVAVSALESSVKGIYKKSEPFYDCRVLVDWLWLWFTIIVFGTSPYVLNHSQQMPKDVGALVKCSFWNTVRRRGYPSGRHL